MFITTISVLLLYSWRPYFLHLRLVPHSSLRSLWCKSFFIKIIIITCKSYCGAGVKRRHPGKAAPIQAPTTRAKIIHKILIFAFDRKYIFPQDVFSVLVLTTTYKYNICKSSTRYILHNIIQRSCNCKTIIVWPFHLIC